MCSSDLSSRSVTIGASAAFSVVAGGGGPYSYRWYFNETYTSPGWTTATLNLANAHPTNAGGYRVVVTNSLGSVTSEVATLSVVVPPAITTQPASKSVSEGSDVVFGVVATGTAPLSYQ